MNIMTITILFIFTVMLGGCAQLTQRVSKRLNPEKANVNTYKPTAVNLDPLVSKSEENFKSSIKEMGPLTRSIEEIKIPEVKIELTPAMEKYCDQIDKQFHHHGWKKSQCEKYQWHHVRNSVLGRPLIWTVFGPEVEQNIKEKDTTFVFCGVHGDEITPIKFCFDIIDDLIQNIHLYQDKLIVVAPIVNPDSFFKKHPTRTNQHGVDVNRNFPTHDWKADAQKLWRTRFRRDKRRFPGKRPISEPETLFQVNLIKRYHPDKILSVHAPLTLLDYDGPGDDSHEKSSHARLANQLLISMSEKAFGYRVKNYPYFPGSLGNWAGKERDIPTYTIELPTSDNRKSKEYWVLFRDAIRQAFQKDLRPQAIGQLEPGQAGSKTLPSQTN